MNKAYTLDDNKEIINDRAANAIIGVTFFILATILGAYVRIPVKGSPVPITLQTLFVMLSGAVLGKRLGAYSQLGYILLGLWGLPVFQGYSSGFAHILGPTGGYLIGFIFAAIFIGKMIESQSLKIYRIIASFIVGNFILYSFGILWLIYLYKINLTNALSIGVLPFMPAEFIKIFFAATIYHKIAQRSKNIFSV